MANTGQLPSNTNEDGTSSTEPTYTLNFDNEVDEWNLIITNYWLSKLITSNFLVQANSR